MAIAPRAGFVPSLARIAPIALIATLGACSGLVRTPAFHERVDDTRLDLPLTPAEVEADLRFLVDRVEEVHCDAYARVSKATIDAEVDAILQDAAASSTRRGFHRRIARLLALYGDAHTGAGFLEEEWSRDALNGERLLPLIVRRDKGSVVVVRQVNGASDAIVPQSKLIAIGGRPIDDVVADFALGASGPPALRDASILSNLAVCAWTEGMRGPFRVDVIAPGTDVVQSRTLAGEPWAKFLERSADAKRAPQPADYEAHTLDGDIVRIDFRSMTDPERFAAFCETTFAEMKATHARGLIVDLRENGGGDSQLGDTLLRYVTTTPYRMCARKDWKVSAPYKTFLKSYAHPAIRWLPLQWFHGTMRTYFGADDGTVVTFGQEDPRTPESTEQRFAGPVVFLIGARTFSSALMLANAVEDYDLACLIGEETAESPNSFGEVYPFDLPRSGLNVRVSTARYVRADGDATNQRGVIPEIDVKPTAAEVVAGQDPVLWRARAWIEDHQPAH